MSSAFNILAGYACGECGMPCTPGEFHPFAACLMFKACHNSDVVRANLEFVRDHAPSHVDAVPGEPVESPLTDEIVERAAVAMDAMNRRPDFLAGVRFAEKFYKNRALTASVASRAGSEPLAEDHIGLLNRTAQDQGVSGIPPALHFARAIEAAHGIGAIAPAAAAEPSEPEYSPVWVDKLPGCAPMYYGVDKSGEHCSISPNEHLHSVRLGAKIGEPDRAGVASLVASEGLSIAQEPKYTVNGSAIVNRASGEAIPADEPVFIFRARDKHAVEVLEFYRDLVRDSSHREAVDKRTGHFYVFKNANPWRMKEPDTGRASAGEAQS